MSKKNSDRIISGIQHLALDIDANKFLDLVIKIHDGKLTVFDLSLKKRGPVD